MKTVPIHVLKSDLATVLDSVRDGERVTVTRHGEPIADIVPHGGALHVGAEVGRAIRPLRSVAGQFPGIVELLAADRASEP